MKWYGLLIEDFEKISHALKKEEVYWDLQFAKAQALAGAGRLDKARQLLDELEAHFREDPEEYLIFLYHRGRIALKQGRKDDAIRDLEKLLRDLQSLRIDVVQKMLDRYSGENDETFWSRQRREQIEEICGLNARPVELKKGTLYLFKAHDLKSALANEILKAHGLLEEEEQKEEESHRLIIEEGD